MRVIYKYPIFRFANQYVELPWGYRILKFSHQGNDMFIWAEVDTEHATDSVNFTIIGTGHEVPENGVHIGTVVLPDGFVWHLYINN